MDPNTFYSRRGEPISLEEWAQAREHDTYVELTRLGRRKVSTIWLGIDHGWGAPGGPVIFETMIFPDHGGYMFGRWRMEMEALAGHWEAVRFVRNRKLGRYRHKTFKFRRSLRRMRLYVHPCPVKPSKHSQRRRQRVSTHRWVCTGFAGSSCPFHAVELDEALDHSRLRPHHVLIQGFIIQTDEATGAVKSSRVETTSGPAVREGTVTS